MSINDKQQVFVNEYCTNGHNASLSYKKAYPKVRSGWNAHGARLIAKDSIKQAISKYMDKIQAKSEDIAAEVARMYRQGYDIAVIQKNSTGMATNTTGLARLNGLLTDNLNTANDQQPDPLSQADRDMLKSMAKELTRPKLVKETA